ncbi:MAG: pilus assembly protein PilP [Archangiaceae bacterium]|nr:pilus assembly protein PilP [Archangiaceae bacterium]
MRVIALCAVLTVVAIACGGSDAPPPGATTTAAAPKPKPVAVPDAGTSIVSTVPYMYNPVGKRDPFRNLLEEVRTTPGERIEGVCADPLCQYDLDQLTLVAVVSGDANPVGMLEDPTKVGHLVRKNSRVGKQGGKVTQLQRDCIVVTEYFQTPDGKVNPNRVNLCIKADKRSVPVLDLLQNKLFDAQ